MLLTAKEEVPSFCRFQRPVEACIDYLQNFLRGKLRESLEEVLKGIAALFDHEEDLPRIGGRPLRIGHPIVPEVEMKGPITYPRASTITIV